MPPDPTAHARLRTLRGLAFGALGVVAFSLTFPATRVAVPELGGVAVGLGRAVIAAALAAAWLAWRRPPRPTVAQWRSLVVVAAGVVVGFPLFSALALARVPASHGAVVIGLLPAATAAVAVLRGGERASLTFWAGALLGTAAVVAFALRRGAGHLAPADALLLLAVACAAIGYGEGGRLSRALGGGTVIAWALILAAPFLALPVARAAAAHDLAGVSARAWAGLAYVSVVSMFLGYFAFYRGLAEGGVARVSQLQLAQPLLTLAASRALLGEPLPAETLAAAAAVVACMLVSVRARIALADTKGELPPAARPRPERRSGEA
jgi:drug/metabolite transporter (DMT)-like permease